MSPLPLSLVGHAEAVNAELLTAIFHTDRCTPPRAQVTAAVTSYDAVLRTLRRHFDQLAAVERARGNERAAYGLENAGRRLGHSARVLTDVVYPALDDSAVPAQ
ncbi:hypothetical protein [Streptomyces hydrogenans]|uniref:hypothetical protein n=1 Tax=Streptomyces hydrogenans TaxID=1873719 RepID=UPI003826F447